MRSGIVLALTLAVGAGVGLAVGLRSKEDRPAETESSTPKSESGEVPNSTERVNSLPTDPGTAIRHDNDRLRARIAELEKELAAPRTAPPPHSIDAPMGPPPFRTDLLPDSIAARLIDPSRLRETDRGSYQLGERILELRDGTEVRLQWAGLPVDQALDPRLHDVSDRILLGRYKLDALRQGFVEVALTNGELRSFETEGEAYRYARREIGDVASFHIETRDLDCAVVDLRPWSILPHVAALEAEMLDAVVEARRLEPAIVAPIVNVRR